VHSDPAEHGKRIGHRIASCDPRTLAPKPCAECACAAVPGGIPVELGPAPEKKAHGKVERTQNPARQRDFYQKKRDPVWSYEKRRRTDKLYVTAANMTVVSENAEREKYTYCGKKADPGVPRSWSEAERQAANGDEDGKLVWNDPCPQIGRSASR